MPALQRPRLVRGNEKASRVRIKPPTWTPLRVHRRLQETVRLVNERLPRGVFLQCTHELADDVPVVRALVGPRDPYNAERFGSFAFYSTQRGMEWYAKLFGPTAFEPHKGMVFVTWFEDSTKDEQPVLRLSLDDRPSRWAEKLLSLFDL